MVIVRKWLFEYQLSDRANKTVLHGIKLVDDKPFIVVVLYLLVAGNFFFN